MASKFNIIVEQIKTALQSISISNGYSYDQTAALVFDWGEGEVLEDDLNDTVLEIRNPIGDADDIEGYSDNIDQIQIAILAAGGTARSTLRDVMSDVKKAMYSLHADATAKAAGLDSISYQGRETEFNREKRLIGETVIFFNLHYKTLLDEM